MPTNNINTANLSLANPQLDRTLSPTVALQEPAVRLADLHVTHSPGLLDARVTLPQAPVMVPVTNANNIPVRVIPEIAVATQAIGADIEGVWKKIEAATDPNGLLTMFRKGQITPEMLEGNMGQLTMAKLNDILKSQQAMFDGVRGILETYAQSLKKAADSLGR